MQAEAWSQLPIVDILASAASLHISIPSLSLAFSFLSKGQNLPVVGQVRNASGSGPHPSTSPVHPSLLPSLSLLVTVVILPAQTLPPPFGAQFFLLFLPLPSAPSPPEPSGVPGTVHGGQVPGEQAGS